MKRNFNTTIRNINGEEMPDSAGKPVPMRDACLSALLVPQEGDDKLDGVRKCDLVTLAFKINKDEEVDLSAEDIVLLKQRIVKVPYNTHMVVYRVHQFLENL